MLDEGSDACSASSLMTQGQEEWPIPQGAVQPFSSTLISWRDPREKLSENQQRQVQGPESGEEQLHGSVQAGG